MSTMNTAWLYETTDEGVRALPLNTSPGEDPLEAAYARIPHGVYEGLRTYDGDRLFVLERHFERAKRGCRMRGLPDFDPMAVRRALSHLLAKHPGNLRVRIDFLPAPAEALGGKGVILLGVRPLILPSEDLYRLGVGVQPMTDLSRDDPEVKGADFASQRHAHEWDTRDNYEPILTTPEGELLEGVMSNFFAVQGRTLRTAGGGVLPGITRQVVLELARDLGLDTLERAVSLGEVGEIDEACLTSSVRGVVPIVRISDHSVGNGQPGPRTLELRDALVRRIQAESRPALG
jgi:branched-chain amino acid aminotransferase